MSKASHSIKKAHEFKIVKSLSFEVVSKIVEAGATSKSIKDYEFTSFIVSKNRLTILKLGISNHKGFLFQAVKEGHRL